MKNIKKLFTFSLVAAFTTAAALAAGAQTAARAAKPAGWQTYKPATGHFSIDLPVAPVIDQQEMNSISPNMKAAYYTAANDKMIVVVSDLYNLPGNASAFSDADKRAVYDNFRDGLLNGIKQSLGASGIQLDVSVTEAKTTKVNGLSGFEQNLKVGSFTGRARMLVAGTRIFLFCALSFAPEGDVMASLDSFAYKGK